MAEYERLSKQPSDGGWVRKPSLPAWPALCLAALVGLGSAALVAARAGAAPAATCRIYVAYSAKTFTDVDAADARAATRVWIRAVARRKGYADAACDSLVFNSTSSLMDAVAAGQADVIALTTLEYLEEAKSSAMIPLFVASIRGKMGEEYVLLVHRQAGVRNISQLRGKTLATAVGGRGDLPLLWLDTHLLRAGQPESKQFFRCLKPGTKASQAVLPVFFRQADACIVAENVFQTMVELNPQLGRELVVLARSPALLPDVVCLRRGLLPEFRADLEDALGHLHEDPQGQQILTLFRVERLVPYKGSLLDPVAGLLKEYRALRGRAGLTGEAAR